MSTAFAATLYSTATIHMGSTTRVSGSVQNLNGNALNGTVCSTNRSGSTSQRMTGFMYTKGAVWLHLRDEVSVYNGSQPLYWANSSQDTGTFWAECQAGYGNHDGYCKIYQTGH